MKITPHLLWDGQVLNYRPWKSLIESELQKCQTEKEKMFFIESHISCKKMLSLIEDCLSTTEIFTCLNAQTAIWRNLLCDMKDGLKNITLAPEDYQIENQNVQALIRYIRACRKNDYPICPSFVEDCQNKLSKRNSEELMRKEITQRRF